ncbi:hypothetical protein DFO73_1282 [Cytobacillus oceanisediminis]|jgi:hypothetical protein|uniref:Uncharacterized protein n=1 Tax=Cytobacillus oceanisediminis TaxID=665099 RepID=A0A2V2ZEG7_9BACI|nr:hypothetical protein DFO73_1282 [Cytobacillus oceanisediminis]
MRFLGFLLGREVGPRRRFMATITEGKREGRLLYEVHNEIMGRVPTLMGFKTKFLEGKLKPKTVPENII